MSRLGLGKLEYIVVKTSEIVATVDDKTSTNKNQVCDKRCRQKIVTFLIVDNISYCRLSLTFFWLVIILIYNIY